MNTQQRHLAIASAVVLLHLGALWALQTGLLRRAVQALVPTEILVQFIEPVLQTPPKPEPPKPEPKPELRPVLPEVVKKSFVPPPAPQPIAIADPTPAPNAPTGVTVSPPPAPIAAPVQAAAPAPVAAPPPAPAPPAPPAKTEPPVLDASYSANVDLFRAPAISVRLNEHGRVLLRLTITDTGVVSKAILVKSSGYERLDQAAIRGALQTRFKPATRAGIPVEVTHLLPVDYKESE